MYKNDWRIMKPVRYLRTETDPVSEMLSFLVFRIPDGQSLETQ
jgi:hypothetical protein